MGTEILVVSDRVLAAVMNGIYQGILITALVALGFRVFRRINAATRHAVWLCTLVLLILLVVAHCFFLSSPPALQPGKIARTAARPEQNTGAPNAAAVAATFHVMPTETGASEPKWPGDLSAEQDQHASPKPDSFGRVLLQPPTDRRSSSPSPPSKEVRVGERRSTFLNAPLPARSSLGEGENYGWSYRDAPDSLSLKSNEPPYEAQKFSVGSLPSPVVTLRGEEPNSPSIAIEPLAPSTADAPSAWFYTAMRRLTNPLSLTLGLESRASRIAGVILLSVCLMLSAVKLFMLLLRLHQIRKLKRQSFPASEDLRELFRGLVTRLGVRRKVDLKTLPTSHSSFVLGFLHPIILLPAEQMEPAEAEQILRHELAHVRRRDDWANLLQHFILAAFPFHPAVWWISRRLSLEREIACDDYVLQSSAHPHAYALLLANLAARMQRCPPLLAPGASNNKTQLQQRIDMILDTQRNTSPRLSTTWLTFMSTATALFAVAAVCLAPRIVLAESASAAPAANAQGSTIDEPSTPAVASVAVSSSPEAGEAASSEAAARSPALGGAPAPGAIQAGAPEPPPTVAAAGEPGDILLGFVNAPIDQIFEKYSDLTGRTVLRPASLQASITITNYSPLTRTAAIQALDGALALNGITMIPQGERFVKAALPATPRPVAIVSGPKWKTGRSIAVNSEPAVAPLAPTPALPVAPAPRTAPTAPEAPMISSAAPAPEPRPGRTPRPARAESADSALEERLERLEKMVESLMARGDATPKLFHLKPAPETVGPIDRKEKEIAELEARRHAELSRKHEMDVRQIERIKEQAKRQAEREVDQARRAAGDAEKIAKDQKRKIKRDSKDGPQRQLDELRKQLEVLEREREKVEHQIEELERSQDQLREEQDEEQETDVQPDTPESNSDSPEIPRQ
jgi:beta-lactamase regulating signal transducer with metallopeptidase domain